MIQKWKDKYYQWQWHRQLQKLKLGLIQQKTNPEKMRLILGVGRSGTTWLVRTLSHTPTPIRYLHEPLFGVAPKLKFSAGRDHTAIGYRPVLSKHHPLVRSYCLFTAADIDFFKTSVTPIKRNDLNWEICLIKEVHGLLATEGVLRSLGCPTVMIVRNPVYVIDSQFSTSGLSHPYLCSEGREVKQSAFLNRYFPTRKKFIAGKLSKIYSIKDKRSKTIFTNVLTVALLQEMLCALASEFECVHLIRYEELCLSANVIFPVAAKFLNLAWDDHNDEYLASTMNSAAELSNAHSIIRMTSQQLRRPFAFLTAEEISQCYQLLHDCGFHHE